MFVVSGRLEVQCLPIPASPMRPDGESPTGDDCTGRRVSLGKALYDAGTNSHTTKLLEEGNCRWGRSACSLGPETFRFAPRTSWGVFRWQDSGWRPNGACWQVLDGN